jgi:uncharacterized protein YfeS
MNNWYGEIDWRKYHPAAKTLLNDPFYWDILDAYSPHGSDDGADVFSKFQAWRSECPLGESKGFLEKLLDSWGINIHFQDAEDTMMDQMRDNAQISLAFAHLKIDGLCPEWCRLDAINSINRRRRFATTDERTDTLDKMKQKLESLAP